MSVPSCLNSFTYFFESESAVLKIPVISLTIAVFLDVTVFTDSSKLSLIGRMIKESPPNEQDDSRIQHYCVKSVDINTQPSMPIMADSVDIGEGSVKIGLLKKALTVMAPSIDSATE